MIDKIDEKIIKLYRSVTGRIPSDIELEKLKDQITDIYLKKLEDQIREIPEYYYWTHNRFKHLLT